MKPEIEYAHIEKYAAFRILAEGERVGLESHRALIKAWRSHVEHAHMKPVGTPRVETVEMFPPQVTDGVTYDRRLVCWGHVVSDRVPGEVWPGLIEFGTVAYVPE